MSNHELAKREPTPMVLMQQAMADPAFDTSKMEKLMELQERWEGNQAKKSFAQAIATFQTKAPIIYKERSVQQGKFYFAGIDDIMRKIRGVLQETGLAVSYNTKQGEGEITVDCIVTHIEGHSQTSSFTMPTDKAMKVNDSQKMGSANSYAKRYALMNALGLTVSDEDDDGLSGGNESISDIEAGQLKALLKETGSDVPKFLKWAGADTVEAIPAKKLDSAMAALKRKGVSTS